MCTASLRISGEAVSNYTKNLAVGVSRNLISMASYSLYRLWLLLIVSCPEL